MKRARVDSFVKMMILRGYKKYSEKFKNVGYDLTDADIKTGKYGRKTKRALVNFCKDLSVVGQSV